MGCYAVLVDGGFLKRRIGSEQHPLNAQKFEEFLAALGAHSALSGHSLHRVYFYDAAPLNESKPCPLNGGTINFGASPTATQNRTLHTELVRMSFVALRMGELGFRGWGLRKHVLQRNADEVTIRANDLQPTYVFTGYSDDGRPTAVAIASTSSQLPGIATGFQPVGTAVGVPRRGNKLGGVVLAMKAYMALCMKSHRSTPWRRQVS